MLIESDQQARDIPATGKCARHDTIEPGLFLYVSPNGHKSWRYAWKDENDRKKTVILGPFPSLDFNKARQWRRACFDFILQKRDPADFISLQGHLDAEHKLRQVYLKALIIIEELEQDLDWTNCRLEKALDEAHHNLQLASHYALKLADNISRHIRRED